MQGRFFTNFDMALADVPVTWAESALLGRGGGGSPVSTSSSNSNPNCDATHPTNAKVINFIQQNTAGAQAVAGASGLSSSFILAWAGYESGYGTSNAATINNNFFGLKVPGAWGGAVNCPGGASPGFACFQNTGLVASGQAALFSYNSQYLQAALDAQGAGGSIADIANAIAAAGFNSEYATGVYGNNVAAAAAAIALRQNCP